MAQSQVEYLLRISSQQAGLMDDGPTHHELCRRWGHGLLLWGLQGGWRSSDSYVAAGGSELVTVKSG